MYLEVHDFNSKQHNITCFEFYDIPKMLEYIEEIPKSNHIKIRLIISPDK